MNFNYKSLITKFEKKNWPVFERHGDFCRDPDYPAALSSDLNPISRDADLDSVPTTTDHPWF